MAEDKKSFIAYCDWGDIFDELEDGEAGRLVKHLFDYVRDKNPEPIDKLTKMMFIQIQQSLKRDLVKYEKYIDKQKVNGAKGGRPKNPTLLLETQPFSEEPKKADSVNDNDSVTDNDILLEKETKAFETFWNDYDKKAGDKSKCKSKFLNLSEKVRKEIMDYIPKYKLSQPDNKYRKNPEVFLNQKGWKHEILKEETASNNNSHVLTGSWKK